MIILFKFILRKVHGIPRAFYNIYKHIRDDDFLKNTKICFVVENNYGHICNQLAGHIENDPRFERYVFLRQKSELLGFHTAEQDSYMNRKFLQQNVALGNIVLAKKLITCNSDIAYTQAKVTSMFKNQLNGLYEFPKRDAKRGPLRNRISSVVDRDGKDKYLNDDIEMAFSIGCSAMLAFFSKSLPMDYIAIDNLPPVTVRVQPFIDSTPLFDNTNVDMPSKKLKYNENNNNSVGKKRKFIVKKEDEKNEKNEKTEWLEEFMNKDHNELPNENIATPNDMNNFSKSHFVNSNPIFKRIKV